MSVLSFLFLKNNCPNFSETASHTLKIWFPVYFSCNDDKGMKIQDLSWLKQSLLQVRPSKYKISFSSLTMMAVAMRSRISLFSKWCLSQVTPSISEITFSSFTIMTITIFNISFLSKKWFLQASFSKFENPSPYSHTESWQYWWG